MVVPVHHGEGVLHYRCRGRERVLDKRRLLCMYCVSCVGMLLVTLGSDGVMLASETGTKSFAAFKVEAVDTTAAGDVFNGYFAAELASRELASICSDLEKEPNEEQLHAAIQQAMAAAAIAVTREGAIPSIPSKQAVADFRRHN